MDKRSHTDRVLSIRWSGLVLAWRKVAPPAFIGLALIVMLSRPIGIWTIPLVIAVAGGLTWIGTRWRHAGLRELGRFVAGFFVFTALRHLADDIGPDAYVRYPIVIDRILGLGTLPTAWLQHTLPNLVYPTVLVYTSYFFVPPSVVGVIWRCWPDRLRPYVSAVLALLCVAALTHIVVPTAPPWIAARLGLIAGVHPVVLDYFHAVLPTAYQFGTGISSNMVAAMPSVHLGITTLIACAFWRTPLRIPALLYLAAMSFTVVYTGDHYVIDVIAGIGLALGCWRWATAASSTSGKAGSISGDLRTPAPEPRRSPVAT